MSGIQRVRSADFTEISELGKELDSELVRALICEKDLVVSGLDVTHQSAQLFEISPGVALFQGHILKFPDGPVPKLKSLDSNPGGSGSRIDVIFIDGPASIDPNAAEIVTASRVQMTTLVRTSKVGVAIGAGDGNIFVFDLGDARVDPKTLKIYANGTQIGGFSFSKGTGLNGVDQILFDEDNPPPIGAIFTAGYDALSQGVEAIDGSAAVRKEFTPIFGIEKAPAVVNGELVLPVGAIPLAVIEVPDGWDGSTTPTSILQSEEISGTGGLKKHLVYPDQKTSMLVSQKALPRTLFSAVRGISQVVHGMRVKYVSTTRFEVTPGWGVMNGVSFRNDLLQTLDIQGADPQLPGYLDTIPGWAYVYAVVDLDSVTGYPGKPASLAVSSTPPSSKREDADKSNGWIYLGAVYVEGDGNIKPFYSHGNWVYWEVAGGLDDSQTPAEDVLTDLDVSEWCPSTGCLLNVGGYLIYEPNAPGDEVHFEIQSHSTNKPAQIFPKLQGRKICVGSTDEYLSFNGPIRAEETTIEGNKGRYIKYMYEKIPVVAEGAKGYVNEMEIYIQGYLDDYRTMDQNGNVLFH
jgi:hypothetical protein